MVLPELRRAEIVIYTVQAGDTVPSIADRFGLAPTTILWANPAVEHAPDLLWIGQPLIILPVDGVFHAVGEGDTLASIARQYGVEADAIRGCVHNALPDDGEDVAPGRFLLVPGGSRPPPLPVVEAYAEGAPGAGGTGHFQWPVRGRVTQGYWHAHRALDVGASEGTAVLASDDGFVSFSGWSEVGYGHLIVVDHADGFTSYYAHLSTVYVAEGQAVERGRVIGTLGNTGNSTGPHLHFEIRRHGLRHNPLAYLP